MPKKYTKEEFIKKAKIVHGDKYDYSRVDYFNSCTKVNIICPEHGLFQQTSHDHLSGKGCKLCGDKRKNLNRTKSKEQFIEEAKIAHGDKYDYSKVDYVNNGTAVEIICPQHGSFWQRPRDHIFYRQGCPICGGVKKHTIEEFIKLSKSIHGDKYDYSEVEYVNNRIPVAIKCIDHGLFYQKPLKHIQGHGCPACLSSKGESVIKKFLDNHRINYIYDKPCLEFLGNLRPDFYLPDYNLIVEYDGVQHFEPIDAFGGEKEFLKIQERDKLKNRLCEENNVSIKRISYLEFNDIEKILFKALER